MPMVDPFAAEQKKRPLIDPFSKSAPALVDPFAKQPAPEETKLTFPGDTVSETPEHAALFPADKPSPEFDSTAPTVKQALVDTKDATPAFLLHGIDQLAPTSIGAIAALKSGATRLSLPGAIAAGTAAQAATAKGQRWLQEKIAGPEAMAVYDKILEDTAKEHPTASAAGEMFGGFPAMLSGKGVTEGIAKRSLARRGVEATQEAVQKAGGKFFPSLIGTQAAFAEMSGGAAASAKALDKPGSENISVPEEIVKGYLGGTALGTLAKPIEKLIPFAKTYLGSIGIKAPSDALVLSVANNVYDAQINDQPLSIEKILKDTGETIPSFVALNAVGGLPGVVAQNRYAKAREQYRQTRGLAELQAQQRGYNPTETPAAGLDLKGTLDQLAGRQADASPGRRFIPDPATGLDEMPAPDAPAALSDVLRQQAVEEAQARRDRQHEANLEAERRRYERQRKQEMEQQAASDYEAQKNRFYEQNQQERDQQFQADAQAQAEEHARLTDPNSAENLSTLAKHVQSVEGGSPLEAMRRVAGLRGEVRRQLLADINGVSALPALPRPAKPAAMPPIPLQEAAGQRISPKDEALPAEQPASARTPATESQLQQPLSPDASTELSQKIVESQQEPASVPAGGFPSASDTVQTLLDKRNKMVRNREAPERILEIDRQIEKQIADEISPADEKPYHEMTVEELSKVRDNPDLEDWMLTHEQSVGLAEAEGRDILETAQSHLDAVRQAVADGKPVPPAVLADYRDLRNQVEPDKENDAGSLSYKADYRARKENPKNQEEYQTAFERHYAELEKEYAPDVKQAESSDKEPWQMTKEEIKALQPNGEATYGNDSTPVYKWTDSEEKKRQIQPGDLEGHKNLIERAISEGKTVPAEVLADYPDLKQADSKPIPRLIEVDIGGGKYGYQIAAGDGTTGAIIWWSNTRGWLDARTNTEQDAKKITTFKNKSAAETMLRRIKTENGISEPSLDDLDAKSFTDLKRQAKREGVKLSKTDTNAPRIREAIRAGRQSKQLPSRTADTMSEAIALSSPEGKMSKQAKAQADERLRVSLFGENGLQMPEAKQPTEAERILRKAKELRDAADRGQSPKAYRAEAERLEAQVKEAGKIGDFGEKIGGFVARPYPEGAERTAINSLFDKFVSEIKTRETDKGVELYSVAGRKSLADKIEQFKSDVDTATLNEEQRGIYDVVIGEKTTAEIRKSDLDELEQYVLLHSTGRNKGAKKIIRLHFGDGARNRVAAQEILDVGQVIRDGQYIKDDVTETSHRYELTANDGARLRVVIDLDQKGNESVINFYSNRRPETRSENTAQTRSMTDSQENYTPGDSESQPRNLEAERSALDASGKAKDFPLYEGRLNEAQSAVKDLAEELGLSVAWVDGPDWMNGSVLSKEGRSVALNANTIDTDGLVKFVFGHEAGHIAETWAAGSSAKLNDALRILIPEGKRTAYLKDLNARRKEAGLGALSEAQALREMSADLIGSEMQNKEFWTKLKNYRPTLFNKLVRWWNDHILPVLRRLKIVKKDGTFETNISDSLSASDLSDTSKWFKDPADYAEAARLAFQSLADLKASNGAQMRTDAAQTSAEAQYALSAKKPDRAQKMSDALYKRASELGVPDEKLSKTWRGLMSKVKQQGKTEQKQMGALRGLKDSITRAFDAKERQYRKTATEQGNDPAPRIALLEAWEKRMRSLEESIGTRQTTDKTADALIKSQLQEFFGEDYYNTIRVATADTRAESLNAVTEWLGEHIGDAYANGTLYQLERVDLAHMPPELNARFEAAMNDVGRSKIVSAIRSLQKAKGYYSWLKKNNMPDAEKPAHIQRIKTARNMLESAVEESGKGWQQIKSLYEELAGINAEHDYNQKNARRENMSAFQSNAMDAAREVSESGQDIISSGQEVGRRSAAKTILEDANATLGTMGQLVSGGNKESLNSKIFGKDLIDAGMKAEQIKLESSRKLTDILAREKVTPQEVIDWQTKLVDYQIMGRKESFLAAELMNVYANMQDMDAANAYRNGMRSERFHSMKQKTLFVEGDPSFGRIDRDATFAEIYDFVDKNLTERQKRIVKEGVRTVTDMGKAANETSMITEGLVRFPSESHWRLRRAFGDNNIGNQRPENQISPDDIAWDDKGFTKSRVQNSNVVLVGDFFKMFDSQVRDMAYYTHMTIPYRMALEVVKSGEFRSEAVARFGKKFVSNMETRLKEAGGLKNHYSHYNDAQKMAVSLERMTSVARIAFRPSTYAKIRVGGSAAGWGVLAGIDEKAANYFLIHNGPTVIRSEGNRAANAAFQRDAFMNHRFFEDPIRVLANLGIDTGEPVLKAGVRSGSAQKAQRAVQNLQKFWLSPLRNAGVRNAINIYNACRAVGHTDARALEITKEVIFRTENPSTPMQETNYYAGIKNAGIGIVLPFQGQQSVFQNLILSDWLDFKYANRHGDAVRKAKAGKVFGYTVAGVAASQITCAAITSIVAVMAKGGLDDDKKKKDAALKLVISSIAELTGARVPLVDRLIRYAGGVAFQKGTLPQRMAAMARYSGDGVDVMPIADLNSLIFGLADITKYSGSMKHADEARVERGVLSLIDGLSGLSGGVIPGGATQIIKVGAGLSGSPLANVNGGISEDKTIKQKEKDRKKSSIGGLSGLKGLQGLGGLDSLDGPHKKRK